MPSTQAFCVEDAINNAILDAIESAELTALDGDDKKAEVIEVRRRGCTNGGRDLVRADLMTRERGSM